MTVKRIMVGLILSMLMVGNCFGKEVVLRNKGIKKTVSNSGKDQSTTKSRLKRVMRVNISAYSLSKKETDGSPHKTSTMERPIPGKTCAVSKDLRHLMGKSIFIVEDNRILKVNDRMHNRYRKSLDIAWYSRKDALKYGRKDVTIVVLN